MRCSFCIRAAVETMQELQHREGLRVGDSVRVRRQRWRVGDVRPFESCRLISLVGTGSLNHGAECRVVVPFERVERLEESRCFRRVRMRLWRRQCRALIADARPAGALQAALHARIELLPYQLEPALAIIRGRGSRVLIADEVGLGKTIQAGLIIAELQAMGATDRVLLLVPAGLREQWRRELVDRFGIDASLVDTAAARRRAAELPVGLNPWCTLPVIVTSIDYAKRSEVLPTILACHWDVVVVDEAHGITPDSDRYRAVSALTARASYVVLLTATPHNGDRAAFDALCDLGKTSDGAGDGLLVFRRRRDDVALGRKRRVHRVDVRSSAAERRMYERLEQFSRALDVEHRESASAALTLTVLHKRALSSAHSLEASVRRRLGDLHTSGANPSLQLALPLDDGGGELNPSDEAPGWTWPALENPDRERRLLENLADAAREAAHHESKLVRLRSLVQRLDARKESVIIFTEYRDTLAHVHRILDRPCALIHGGLSRDERRTALDDFQSGRSTVLLATDAAGEGLNLHHTCRAVVNLELPWNPVRLEQRIGRVDRIGQTRRVHAFNLISIETGEQRVFERLAMRIASARAAIGSGNPLAPGIGERMQQLSACEDIGTGLPVTSVPLVRLEEEATREGRRLIGARALGARVPRWLVPDAIRPSIARAAASITRSRLGGRMLVVLRAACVDMTGHEVAAHLVPLLVRPGGRVSPRRPREAEAVLRAIEPELEMFLDKGWLADAAATIERFWQTRMAREQSIARDFSADLGCESQPGLFDRRAERARAAKLEAHREHASIAGRRLRTILRRSRLAPPDLRTVLLLVG